MKRIFLTGIVLIELVIVLAVISIVSTLSVMMLQEYRNRVDISKAAVGVRLLSQEINMFRTAKLRLPTSLSEVASGSMVDPWGNSYQYFNIEADPTNSAIRKTGDGVNLNSDFDLYSKGKNGLTAASIAASNSLDDIVRGNDGRYIGLGQEY